MMPKSPLDEAKELADVLLKNWPSPLLDASEVEGDLQRFLEILKRTPEARDLFGSWLIRVMESDIVFPQWLIAYAMRDLRWPEIREAAARIIRLGHPRLQPRAHEVLEAYEDEWVGKALFHRYRTANDQ